MTNYLQGDWTRGCGFQPQFCNSFEAASENQTLGLSVTRHDSNTSQCEENPVKVLLVSADRLWADKISDELAACGLQVNSALDGVLAVEQLKKVRPEFLICDVPMPRMNGLELACWIRDQDDNTPIILVDDPDLGINKTLSILVGANKLLPKNNDSGPILNAIRAIKGSIQRTKR